MPRMIASGGPVVLLQCTRAAALAVGAVEAQAITSNSYQLPDDHIWMLIEDDGSLMQWKLIPDEAKDLFTRRV